MNDDQARVWKIAGRLHDLEISFPVERGILFSVAFKDRSGVEVDRFDKVIPEEIYNQYRMFMPTIAGLIKSIMR